MMPRALATILLVAAVAGCSASGSKPDYFGYTKKAIYTGTFDLAAGPDGQKFFVDDGSIGQLKAQVWINATAGGATITFTDARHRDVWTTSASGASVLPPDLGEWSLNVTPTHGAAGSVGIVVLRS